LDHEISFQKIGFESNFSFIQQATEYLKAIQECIIFTIFPQKYQYLFWSLKILKSLFYEFELNIL